MPMHIPQDLPERNRSFSREVPGLQLAWDSTSLGALKECPRKYYYLNVAGIAPAGTSRHLTFGLIYHSALERYDHARSAGDDHDKATVAAVKHAMVATWDKSLGRGWASGDSNKNRQTLLRSIVWYLEYFREDPLETVQLNSGKPAVEVSFRLDAGLTSGSGEPMVLCGHLDRLAKDSVGKVWLLDRKTTTHTMSADFFLTFSPDNQMDLYDFAGQAILAEPLAGIIIDAAQIAVTFTRYMRGQINRTQSQREEWLAELPLWLSVAEVYAKTESWPMNTKSCGSYGGCPFRPICSSPPSIRDQWLRGGGFTTRVWDPLKVRGNI